MTMSSYKQEKERDNEAPFELDQMPEHSMLQLRQSGRLAIDDFQQDNQMYKKRNINFNMQTHSSKYAQNL